MKPTSRTAPLFLFLLSFVLSGLTPWDASAQEAEEEAEVAALTFRTYPSRFTSDRPLTPTSEVLLKFNAPVDPRAAAGYLRFYDKPNQVLAAAQATRPDEDRILDFQGGDTVGDPIDRYVLLRPFEPLAVGGTWYLHARQGLTSESGDHRVNESRLDYLGTLAAFTIDAISPDVPYDDPNRIVIHHNKASLSAGYTEEKLEASIEISPRPDNFAVESQRYRILLNGDFEYGVDYRVTLREGLVANDETQLNQSVTDTVTLEPNEGFVGLPAFTTTQNATGHRRFDIRSGNLTGLRTRVKSLEGDQLIIALNEYDEKYEGWGEEQALLFSSIPGSTVHDEFRETTAGIDQTEEVTLDWDELTNNATTGAFFLCAEGKSSTRRDREVGAQSLVQLTDLGLSWKQSDSGTVLYVFSIKDGTPVADADVRLVESSTAVRAEATTDAAGLARIPASAYANLEDVKLFLDVEHGRDRHAMRFFERLNSMGLWSFSIQQRYSDLLEDERRTLLFTDRNVYRPGDEVKLKAITRFVNDDSLLGPGAGDAVLRVFDPRRRTIVERDVSIGAGGGFDDSFTLPSAGMGWHTIELDFNPPEGDRNWRRVVSHSFQVEEYRVNTFEVSINHDDAYAWGEEITLPVSAKYYMGKPLSKAELQWNYYAYSQYPRPRGFDEFDFGDLTVDRETFSADGTVALTSDGEATIPVELPEQDTAPGPRRVTISTRVTDANQQTISQNASFIVHSSDFYLGLCEPDGVHRAGDTPTFSLAAVSAEGGAHTDLVPTTVLVEKEIWNTVKVMGANGRMTHRNDRRLETVSEETIDLVTEVDSETGIARAVPHQIPFEEAGDYIITLTARDASNRPVLTRTRFTVIGAEEPSWSWHDVIRIDMIPDRSSYTVGDTAKVLLRTPVFGTGVLTTERGGVRTTRSLEITDYETVVEIPIEEGDAPNIFASAFLVRGSGESPHIHASADYRLGYCELEVDDPATHLDIAIDTGEPDYYQPGEEVTVSTRVTDSEGSPVSGAEVTFFAVDEGVLSLTGHQTPDPHDVFHEIFPLSVKTGQSISSLLPENPLEQDFGNKGYVIGGGGHADGLNPDRVRKDFKALAFWEPALVTDADGTVRATFTAPDNLTEFRVMAVVAEGNRFGHADSPVVINKPLIIEPALPVFTNLTDQVDVSAVLHNNTESAQEVEIEVALDDHAIFVESIGDTVPTAATTPEDTLRTVRAVLEPGSTETFSFPIAMTATGEAKWTWKVRSLTEDRLRDATESTIEVGYPLPLLRESHSFTLREGETLEEALGRVAPRLLDGTGSVHVALSNSRLVEAGDALDYLLDYPYGCVEQTTSSLIPWLSTQQLRPVMPKLDKSEEHVTEVIEKGVERLFTMQTSDGGLGYWPGANSSVLWGSAYAGVAVAMARDQGVEISEESMSALWKYLSQNLRETGKLENTYELSQRALSCYALALAGVDETSYHEILFGKRDKLSLEARSLLALAMIEAGTGTPDRVGTLLAPSAAVPVAEVSWYKRPYLAATRLLAQVRFDPGSERVDTLLEELMELRTPVRGWGSTYSNAWPLIALAKYSEATSASLESNSVLVRFENDEKTVDLAAEPDGHELSFDFEDDLEARSLSIAPGSEGTVHATVKIETRPDLMPIEPENNGFAVSREYQKVLNDGSIAPAEELRVGDLILVTLDFNIPNERETYLAIDDPLPAIFEAINPTFKSQSTQRVNRERNARTLYTSHREIRKDRMLFFVDSVYRAGDYSLQYLARVVAPGEVTAPPTKIEAMYEPQRFGLGGTERIAAEARQLGRGEIAVR